MPVFYCEMSSGWGAGRRFPQHVQAFKAGSNAISSCSVFKQSKCSGIFKSSASLVLPQIISKLPIIVFLHSPTSVPHKVTTVSSLVPIWSSLLLFGSIYAEVALIPGMLGSSPPEIYKPFSEFYLPPLLSTDGAQAGTADVLDHHPLRGSKGATLQMRGGTSGSTLRSHWRRLAGTNAASSKPALTYLFPYCCQVSFISW